MTELQVSFPTASKAITQLETMGLLHEVSGRKRDRQFCARDILGRISPCLRRLQTAARPPEPPTTIEQRRTLTHCGLP